MAKDPVRVLLMEDDEGLARLCRLKLEKAGYLVEHAPDGEQGLARYDAGIYDVLLLDHAMPVYDGLEVIRRLSDRGPLPPVVMVTGTGNEEIAVEAMRRGACDYLVKDVDAYYLDLLPTVIERAIGRKKAEDYTRLAAKVIESAAEGILVADREARIISVNKALSEITGYEPEELVGKNPRVFQSGQNDVEFYRKMWAVLKKEGKWQGEIWNRRKNGEAYPAWMTISVVADERGQVANYVGISNDITSLKQTEERLRFLATHDPLTTLPNRVLFYDRLAQALHRRNQPPAAVMMLDLDRFKTVNDTMGHAFGDMLLKEIAARLKGCLRDGDTAARIGGDEFTVLLPDLADSGIAGTIARRILGALARPFVHDGREYAVTVSIGVSLHPGHGDDPETLLKNADTAMYRAKEQRNCWLFYETGLPSSPA